MKKFLSNRFVFFGLLAAGVVAAYFINVEVQSYWGRQALAKANLTSLPLAQALAKAKAESKLVLVDVSAIWCPTCRALDEKVFADMKVRQMINENFIFSRLEYESEEGTKFLKEHNASGFPNLWLLDGDGKIVRRLRVTFDPNEFLQQLATDR